MLLHDFITSKLKQTMDKCIIIVLSSAGTILELTKSLQLLVDAKLCTCNVMSYS